MLGAGGVGAVSLPPWRGTPRRCRLQRQHKILPTVPKDSSQESDDLASLRTVSASSSTEDTIPNPTLTADALYYKTCRSESSLETAVVFITL